ncbi:TSUP family transporter [Clostridia bacterium]|nr:TSUP family transporter [Clostridia bacterium]
MLTIIFICFAGFFGAFIDAIVGGGGLITVPALLAAGLPTHIALGTNKFAASFGTMSSSYHYYRSGNINFKLLKFLVPLSLIGSALGVKTVLSIEPKYLSILIIFLVFSIIIYTAFKKKLGLEENFKGIVFETVAKGMLLALALGFYDGFFGPGTGSFLIFGLIYIFGYDFKKASANSKILNLTSNSTAFILFMLNRQINYSIALPMALSMIVGAKLGSHMAINKGSKFIKPVFLIVSLSLVIKMIFDLL